MSVLSLKNTGSYHQTHEIPLLTSKAEVSQYSTDTTYHLEKAAHFCAPRQHKDEVAVSEVAQLGVGNRKDPKLQPKRGLGTLQEAVERERAARRRRDISMSVSQLPPPVFTLLLTTCPLSPSAQGLGS